MKKLKKLTLKETGEKMPVIGSMEAKRVIGGQNPCVNDNTSVATDPMDVLDSMLRDYHGSDIWDSIGGSITGSYPGQQFFKNGDPDYTLSDLGQDLQTFGEMLYELFAPVAGPIVVEGWINTIKQEMDGPLGDSEEFY